MSDFSKQNKEDAESGAPVSIYKYFNYRKFLKDLYQYKKSMNKNFSYRFFSRKAGINSSAIYLLLVQERQNMTPNLLPKFAKGLDLNSVEAQYLECMVAFTHAKTPEAKQLHFEKMVDLLPPSAKELTAKESQYYQKWYHVAIREALAVLDVGDEHKPLAKFLLPPLKLIETRKALELLADLKLIEKNEKGFWKATDGSLHSTPELGALWIRGFQKSMMEKAQLALETVPSAERNISASTFSISEEGMNRINHKMNQFLADIENIVRLDENEFRVYQFNMQLFPLSEKHNPPKEKEPLS